MTPVDLSYVYEGIDDQIRRLGWTEEQVREHMFKICLKRARTLLNEEELIEFLISLEEQP